MLQGRSEKDTAGESLRAGIPESFGAEHLLERDWPSQQNTTCRMREKLLLCHLVNKQGSVGGTGSHFHFLLPKTSRRS